MKLREVMPEPVAGMFKHPRPRAVGWLVVLNVQPRVSVQQPLQMPQSLVTVAGKPFPRKAPARVRVKHPAVTPPPWRQLALLSRPKTLVRARGSLPDEKQGKGASRHRVPVKRAPAQTEAWWSMGPLFNDERVP